VLIPGFVGGRSVKWLSRIWITDHENESYYHIWDNRVLPSFITEKDGEFARTMFSHPSTACMEQNLNSVIVRPGQGETLDMADLLKCDTYRVRGFAYDGGGHEVQRVELSLDNGATWLYCIRHFPDLPVRNGRKFWTWVHWHVDIDSAHLARAESLTVRCFNCSRTPSHNTRYGTCWA
jgi:nitrate reductase (NAD(P)H)